MKKRIRPLGKILLEIEPLILELAEDHDLQYGDLLGLLYTYMMVHLPGAKEEYEDGTSPVFYYGPAHEDGDL